MFVMNISINWNTQPSYIYMKLIHCTAATSLADWIVAWMSRCRIVSNKVLDECITLIPMPLMCVCVCVCVYSCVRGLCWCGCVYVCMLHSSSPRRPAGPGSLNWSCWKALGTDVTRPESFSDLSDHVPLFWNACFFFPRPHIPSHSFPSKGLYLSQQQKSMPGIHLASF